MARQRIAALDEQIAALESARQSLARLAKDCARGGEGPCPILAAFDGG
jgi:MerR family mercuric resistance operon transcriptional regulator